MLNGLRIELSNMVINNNLKKLFLILICNIILSTTSFAKEKREPLTLEDINKLGEIPILKKLPEDMYENLKDCKPYNERFTTCESKKAGKIVGETFRKKGGYAEKFPGKMMEAMAYYEILYLSSFYKNRKYIEKFKKNFDKKGYPNKRHKSIRSLIKMNDGREKMRSALGMTLDTSTEEAINRFWTLGEFLGLGTPKKLGKLDKDLNERKRLLQKYKSTVSKLSEKIQEEKDKKLDSN